jgi:hypothetical protein
MTSGHIIFDGPNQNMKFYLTENGVTTLRHNIEARGDAVGIPTLMEPYGLDCKTPPGEYFAGVPEVCGQRDPHTGVVAWNPAADDQAYGCFFTPLLDPHGILAAHGRAGNGAHGGGSALPKPFDLLQGWTPTEGCIRMQNRDNEQIFVPFVRDVRAFHPSPDTAVRFTVIW